MAYNTNKDLLATLLKNHSAFDNASFEAQGHLSEQINYWMVLAPHRRLAQSFVGPNGPSDVAGSKE